MMNIYKNIDYNKLRQIRSASFFSVIGCSVCKEGLMVCDDFFLSLELVSMIIYINSMLNKTESKTSDVKEIRKIYDEIINDYNKLNDIFGLNDPVEIYKMFTYLLNNGYLSNNKEFSFSENNIRDIDNIQGANVINGEGVCRHVAPMLNDIYKNKGIESETLIVKAKPIDVDVVPNFNPDISLEELCAEVEKIVIPKERAKLLNEYIKIGGGRIRIIPSGNKSSILEKLFIRHVIVKTLYDEKIHFLAPTLNRIYKYSEDKNVLYDEAGIVTLRKKKGLNLESTSFIDDLKKVTSIERLCNDNLDIIDAFYYEHSEAYAEISNKMSKIKKRRNPFF